MGNTHIHSPDQVRRPRRNKMAPVEIDHIPRSFSIENLNLKAVDKAMELPLVNSAYTEVTRIASPITPYVESTLTKVTPMVEAGYQTIKTQVEEKVVPHIPTTISDSVTKNMNATLETVFAAKETVDSYACSGIDQLTEKVPQLVLKVTDAGLNVVEDVIKMTGTNEESTVVTGVRKIHSTAKTMRLSGLKKAGTEKAKKIEEATIAEAVLFMLGVTDLLTFLGFKLAKKDEVEEKSE